MLKIADYEQFDRENAYFGEDLGANVSAEKTYFRTWSPLATAVYLNIYADGTGNNRVETLPFYHSEQGTWYVELLRPLYGYFYTYTYEFDYKNRYETIDIYAKACGINGDRGAVIDFSATNPPEWETTPQPVCPNPCEMVVYECHVRDFSKDVSSGVSPENRGKFAGFTEPDTLCGTQKTCFSHLKELGITHVQLLPVADYATVDETHPDRAYNWGYDPKNYNCLEGSYASDPTVPEVRVREFKQLVCNLHNAGIGVIMDVVYNHTYASDQSAFHKSFPFYYHRSKNGQFTNGSGCGNETASDHAMMRKFMRDSLVFWATEYKIDGFRFDLMGLHDIDTMNYLLEELRKVNPQIILYGEGWTGGESPLHSSRLALKFNAGKMPQIGLFNDNHCGAIKGENFNAYGTGYVSGNIHASATIRRGLAGSCPHWQLHNIAQDACWAMSPAQSMNYVEVHDNLTLWDKLGLSAKHDTEEERIKMDKLCAAILLLSQGVPFFHLGQDFLRTKPREPEEGVAFSELEAIVENSYNAPDYTNSIKWARKQTYHEVFAYVKALIALRRANPLFRLSTQDAVNRHLKFHAADDPNVIVCSLADEQNCFVFGLNPYAAEQWFTIPSEIAGVFCTALDENGQADDSALDRRVKIPPISALVLKRI